MSTDMLFFDGYADAQPGDLWTAWRCEVCVGNIRCQGNDGSFTVLLSIGQAFRRAHGIESLDEAKEMLCQMFAEWAADTGLLVQGASRIPSYWQEPQEWLIPAIKGITTSAGVKSYMNTDTVFRTIAGIRDNYQRKRILGEAKIHMEKLQREEAARGAGEAA